MIIPYSTDAPIYHWPIATIGMIVLNIGVYFACVTAATESAPVIDPDAEIDPAEMITQYMGSGSGVDPYEEVINPYILHYGRLWPPEWVTSNFMHANLFHLLGNMFGLWGLGLIVEGKVGWWRFVLIFLGIGVAQCAMEQTMTLGMVGGSLGASSIVFGLLAICLIWAPKNELSCVMFWGHRISAVDIGVISYCIILFSLEIVMMLFSSMTSGITITSAVLHFMGALVGAVIGALMLKLDWVDCEQWDLFTVLAGRAGQRPQRKPKQEVEEKETPEMRERRREMALSQIRDLIADGQPQLAYAAHKRMSREFKDWQLSAGDFFKLIAAYLKQQLWDDSVMLMVEYLRLYQENIARVRLELARVLIEHSLRPAQALRVMDGIPQSELTGANKQQRDQLAAQARQLQEEGEMEVQTENW